MDSVCSPPYPRSLKFEEYPSTRAKQHCLRGPDGSVVTIHEIFAPLISNHKIVTNGWKKKHDVAQKRCVGVLRFFLILETLNEPDVTIEETILGGQSQSRDEVPVHPEGVLALSAT